MSWKDDKVKEWLNYKKLYTHIPTPPSTMVGKLLCDFNFDEKKAIQYCEQQYQDDLKYFSPDHSDDWMNYWLDVKTEIVRCITDDIISNP